MWSLHSSVLCILSAFTLAEVLPGTSREISFYSDDVIGRAYENPAFNQFCNETDKSIICTSCSTIQVCMNGTAASNETACPTGRPNCVQQPDQDFCSLTSDTERCAASVTNSNFMCTSVGIFPDPNNCNIYHQCTTANALSQPYDCPEGYVFNEASPGTCRRRLSDRDCLTVTCSQQQLFVTFGTRQKFYAYCNYNGEALQNIFMYQCSDGAQYSVNEGRCIFRCLREGRFSNTINPAAYYECYISSGRLVSRTVLCRGETVFNAQTRLCENL